MPQPTLALDLYQTAGIGVVALLLGIFFTRSIPFLKRCCIPAPVSGGLVISLLLLAIHALAGVDFRFDGTLKDLCMMLFFTSVGFQCDLRLLKKGGRPLAVMLLLVTLLIVMQNLLSLGIGRWMGLDPLVGLAAGSIPMCGGHGTAGGFSPLLEEMGLESAASITMACATFGLVAGSLIGGPLAESLIRRRQLSREGTGEEATADDGDTPTENRALDAAAEASSTLSHADPDEGRSSQGTARLYSGYSKAVFFLVLTMALGSCLNALLRRCGITFPTYFGSLLCACLIRNLCDGIWKKQDVIGMDKVVPLGNICLSLFLGMAMATLKLWELADLVLPLCVILLVQILFIVLLGRFVAFPALGGDYDAAVLVSGLCGFGLGATPNAMANMSAVCYKYHYARTPFIIVPIVGVMFVDLINTGVITLFLNLI